MILLKKKKTEFEFDFGFNKYKGIYGSYVGVSLEYDITSEVNAMYSNMFDYLRICAGVELPLNLKLSVKIKQDKIEQNYGISSSDYSYGLTLFGKAGFLY